MNERRAPGSAVLRSCNLPTSNLQHSTFQPPTHLIEYPQGGPVERGVVLLEPQGAGALVTLPSMMRKRCHSSRRRVRDLGAVHRHLAQVLWLVGTMAVERGERVDGIAVDDDPRGPPVRYSQPPGTARSL